MQLEKRLEKLERQSRPEEEHESETVVVLPDNGRGDIAPGRYGCVVILPPEVASDEHA